MAGGLTGRDGGVDSMVLAIDRIPVDPTAEDAVRLATAAFNQRRKRLRSSLAAVLDEPVAVLEHAGIDPSCRAEDLEPGDFLSLARAVP